MTAATFHSKKQIKKLVSSRLIRVALTVATLIPLLYGVLYLWAFWDPSSRMNNIPVAIVNEDVGTSKDSQKINLGNDLVNELEDNDALKFCSTNENEAKKGLENYNYYAEIKIPADFSQKTISVGTNNPKKANLIFIARESNSMIGAQLINRVASEISHTLSTKISKNYFENIFVQTASISDKMNEASDASSQIAEGANKIAQANQSLADGTVGLHSGTVILSDAINQILNGSGTVTTKLSDLAAGSQKLDNGLSQVSSSLSNLTDGTQKLSTASDETKNGVDQLIKNTNATITTLQTINTLLDSPDTINISYGITNKQVAQLMLSTIVNQAQSASNLQNIAALQSGMSQLKSGLSDLSDKTEMLDLSYKNQILPASTQIKSGTSQLVDASGQISTALSKADNGASKLDSGLSSVISGQRTVGQATNQLQNGAASLSSKLSDGAKEIKNNANSQNSEQNLSVLSDPINLKDASVDRVENYGTGFAPYFIPLSLWVGALVLFLIIRVDGKDQEEAEIPSSILALSKYLTLIKFGALQAIILDLVLIFALGLRPLNYILFFFFTILISWCFLAILQFLISALQDGGKFLGILLLMLQLTSASGTYPIETSPKFFSKISPYLPMTYAVKGLREIISGGNMANIKSEFIIIVVIAVAFLMTLVLSFDKMRKSKINLAV